MSRPRGRIRDQSASFWIGAGFVAEFPVWLLMTLAPAGTCEFTFGPLTGCPLPVWLVIALALIAYVATACLAHRLGLGD